MVSCSACDLDELQQFATALHARPDGGFRLPDDPFLGFEYVGESPGMASEGTNVRQVTYGDGNGHGFRIAVTDDSDTPPLAQLSPREASLVDVRGTQAVIGARLNAPGSMQSDTLFMQDPNVMMNGSSTRTSR